MVIPLEEADAKTMIALFSISIIVKWFINPSVLFLDQKQNHIGHTGDSLPTRSLEKNVYCLISWWKVGCWLSIGDSFGCSKIVIAADSLCGRHQLVCKHWPTTCQAVAKLGKVQHEMFSSFSSHPQPVIKNYCPSLSLFLSDVSSRWKVVFPSHCH